MSMPQLLDEAAKDGLEEVSGLKRQDLIFRILKERVKLNGEAGLSTYLSNESPVGGQETDWLVTVLRPQGLVSFLCVAPKDAFPEYEKTFTAMLDSVRLK